ncbi:MAG: sulfurtransferase-like selenium metabolism protein YedF [Chitinophagales bacterium]
MDRIVDARGMDSPQSAIMTRKALQELNEGEIVTVVDTRNAMENVIRLARSLAYGVEVEEKENEFHIHIEKTVASPQQEIGEYYHTVILIKNQYLGEGNDTLGKTLMKSFLFTLTENPRLTGSIIFVNSAVVLTTQGSEVLDHLLDLEHSGVEIISSGTCLDFYNLRNQVMVGRVSNMYTIVERLATAQKVITL